MAVWHLSKENHKMLLFFNVRKQRKTAKIRGFADVRDVEAAGSNPVTSTNAKMAEFRQKSTLHLLRCFLFFRVLLLIRQENLNLSVAILICSKFECIYRCVVAIST